MDFMTWNYKMYQPRLQRPDFYQIKNEAIYYFDLFSLKENSTIH